MTFVLDAHLLLLLVVGSISPTYIAMHRRLQNYSATDFRLLEEMLARASKIALTPNTLTEASNLAGYVREPARTHIFDAFRRLIGADIAQERYVESKSAVGRDEFARIGLTDVVLLEVAADSSVLLTADLNLYLAALDRGLNAQNFNHFRDL